MSEMILLGAGASKEAGVPLAYDQDLDWKVLLVEFRQAGLPDEMGLMRGNENLVPKTLDCVEAYATVGEITNRLRNVWGECRETTTV